MGAIITIWFIIILLMVIAGILLRLVPRKLPPVQLRKVAPVAASRLVSDFIASSYESDFGYPSGYLRIEQASEDEVIAREYVAKGSHFTHMGGHGHPFRGNRPARLLGRDHAADQIRRDSHQVHGNDQRRRLVLLRRT